MAWDRNEGQDLSQPADTLTVRESRAYETEQGAREGPTGEPQKEPQMERDKALDMAVSQIERQFGKGRS